jgi:hypothetical protein
MVVLWDLMAAWWFGTFFNFSNSVGKFIIPTDEVMFFRGVAKNHQPDKYGL